MPKLKNYGKGRRITLWLREPQLKTHDQIENFSAFVQLAVDQAPDIMAWAILHSVDPKKYRIDKKLEDYVDKFNEKYPQDELTQKRQGKWRKPSQKLPDILS